MTATNTNPYLAAELSGLQVYTTLTGVNKVVIQSLIDLITPEFTQTPRGHLDQMSPAARAQLIAELNAVLAAVENA